MQYDGPIHPSFHCEHNADITACKCQSVHPTHSHGNCRSFHHTDGTHHVIDGGCTDSGRDAADLLTGYTT